MPFLGSSVLLFRWVIKDRGVEPHPPAQRNLRAVAHPSACQFRITKPTGHHPVLFAGLSAHGFAVPAVTLVSRSGSCPDVLLDYPGYLPPPRGIPLCFPDNYI